MDACQPRLRHRGFFLHSDTGEPDTGEHENAEGLTVRVRIGRSTTPRHIGSSGRYSAGRQSREELETAVSESLPAIRSGSVTGSRQRAHLPRSSNSP